MWVDEIIKGSFKPSIIVNADEVIEMYSDKIEWRKRDGFRAHDFCADIAEKVNYTFDKSITNLSSADIAGMIPNIVKNAKLIYDEYHL